MEPIAYCGVSENVAIGTNGWARSALSQRAEEEKTSLTNAGALLLSWSFDEECLNQTADLDQKGPSYTENGQPCIELLKLGIKDQEKSAKAYIKQNPNRITIYGNAPSNELDEGNAPILDTVLSVPGYTELSFRDQEWVCGSDIAEGFVDLSQWTDEVDQ